ncbi:MAG: transketolase [Bacteroidota bacterium]
MFHENLQQKLRLKIIELHFNANAGHIASSLSVIDILIVILFSSKKQDDTLILSKGHAASALYACLNELGSITNEELSTFYKNDTRLPAHPPVNQFIDIPFATGSLGHGFPLAAGIATANKLQGTNYNVFAVLSDGDTNEGTTWETANFVVKNKLNNLITIIDKNKIQGFNRSEEAIGDTSKKEVFEAIGFEVFEINGHNIDELTSTIKNCTLSISDNPKLIIANTIKGKGVSFMENTIDWHYWPMNEEQNTKAIEEIKRNYHA